MGNDKKFWTSETQLFYKRNKVIKCHGNKIEDEDGNIYLDMNSGTWNVLLGYGRDEFKDPFAKQIDNVQYTPNLRLYHEQGPLLAEKILSKLPDKYSNVYFASSGSEAVETAIKIAKQYWYNLGKKNKTRVISFYESFHGSTLGAMSVSGDPWDRVPYDPMIKDSLKIYPQYCYKCRLGLEKKCCNYACLKDLQYQIDFYGAENISSIILEPIMGVGGVLIPEKKWLSSIVDICHKNNIIVIFDEVTSGFGRCGDFFAANDYKIFPDIITFGKIVSNGVIPLSGVISTKKIFDAFIDKDTGKQLRHGFTNSGHPLSCLAGNIVIDIIDKENLMNTILEKEQLFKKHLEKLKNEPYIGEIRIKGLMVAIELIDPDTKLDLIIPELEYRFKSKGIIMSQMTQVVCFMPYAYVTETEIIKSIDILKEVVTEYLKERLNK